KEGDVDVRAETSDGETVQFNFAPEVSEKILWSILSTKGMTYANEWKTWPLAPDGLTRELRSDGSMDLLFSRQGVAAFRVRIQADFRQALLRALTQETSSSTARTGDPH